MIIVKNRPAEPNPKNETARMSQRAQQDATKRMKKGNLGGSRKFQEDHMDQQEDHKDQQEDPKEEMEDLKDHKVNKEFKEFKVNKDLLELTELLELMVQEL
mgnify:CR=1 FL=1